MALVALAIAGVAAGALAGYQWSNVTGYRSPYLFRLPVGESTPPLTERVLLVIVDGLRDDTAGTLPTFRRLAGSGVRTTARTTQPSLSLPGWTLMSTGAPPFVSGITSNFYEEKVHTQSLFSTAQRTGSATAISGHEVWNQLHGHEVTAGDFEGHDDIRSDEAVGDGAVRVLTEASPGLLILHLPDTDNAGHIHGVGSEYERNAREADTVVGRVLAAAGPETTVLYTSDHGHVQAGGHGGPEAEVTTSPLAMAGPGILAGADPGPVSHESIAPTIAALLGLPRPAHATGDVLLSALDADAETRAAIAEAHGRVRARFEAAAAAAIGEPGQSFAAARAARQRQDVLLRAPLAIAALTLLVLAVRRATRGLDRVAMAAGVLTFLGVWAAIFFGQGLTFSLSHFNTEDQIVPFLSLRLLEAVIAGLVGSLVAGLIAGRRRHPARFRTGVGTAAWSMIALAAPVAVFLAIYGWGFTWRLPDLAAAFAQYLLLLGMLGVGLTAGVAGLVAGAGARIAAPRSAAP